MSLEAKLIIYGKNIISNIKSAYPSHFKFTFVDEVLRKNCRAFEDYLKRYPIITAKEGIFIFYFQERKTLFKFVFILLLFIDPKLSLVIISSCLFQDVYSSVHSGHWLPKFSNGTVFYFQSLKFLVTKIQNLIGDI